MRNIIPIGYLAHVHIYSAETVIQLFTLFVLAGYLFNKCKFFRCYFLEGFIWKEGDSFVVVISGFFVVCLQKIWYRVYYKLNSNLSLDL